METKTAKQRKTKQRFKLTLDNRKRSNYVQTCSYSTNIPTQFIFHEVKENFKF